MKCGRKFVLQLLVGMSLMLSWSVAASNTLDPCLRELVKDLESKTGSKVVWSWTVADSDAELKKRRERFKKADGTFCYLATMRGNQQHLLCGENEPFAETKFLYTMHGLDNSVVEKKCPPN